MDNLYRILIFIFFLITFLLLQKWRPLKKDNIETFKRFFHNFFHVFISQIFLFMFFYITGKNFFELSNFLKWGLFYQINTPNWLNLIITFIVFDLALYIQHSASHKWPWFWKIHKVHHSDNAMTVSTAVRFHFLEIFISALWKGFIIILLGVSLRNFIWFEVFLSSCSLFNHSNIKLKEDINKVIEKFLFTPKLHRIHHSTDSKLALSNFGFSIILWDKLFNSFNESKDVQTVGIKNLNWHKSFWSQLKLK